MPAEIEKELEKELLEGFEFSEDENLLISDNEESGWRIWVPLLLQKLNHCISNV